MTEGTKPSLDLNRYAEAVSRIRNEVLEQQLATAFVQSKATGSPVTVEVPGAASGTTVRYVIDAVKLNATQSGAIAEAIQAEREAIARFIESEDDPILAEMIRNGVHHQRRPSGG